MNKESILASVNKRKRVYVVKILACYFFESPENCRTRIIGEFFGSVYIEDSIFMISFDNDIAALADKFDALIGICAIADNIAKADNRIR